jgi:hypothetical protein
MLQTGEMQFGDMPMGIYLTHQDVLRYFDALHTVLAGRKDPISVDTVEELIEVLREAEDDEIVEIQKMKPYPECVAR